MLNRLSIIMVFLSLTIYAYGETVKEKPVTVFDLGEGGSRYYRIPAITLAADSSLVALADKRGDSSRDLPNIISVVSKRSTDGGKTWSEAVTIAQGDSVSGATYGDPAVITDSFTGTIVAVFSGDNGFFYSDKNKRAGFYVSRSYDNGITWETPRAITDMLYQPGWEGSFASSGRMLQTSDGKILFAADTRTNERREFKDIYVFVCYSDDCGETWKVLNPDTRIPSDGLGNESKLVNLNDGRLLLSMRNPRHRRFSISEDGGKTWSDEYDVTALIEPDCNGDLIRVNRGSQHSLLLHSIPADSEERRNVSVYISADDGKTWPVLHRITDLDSGYSSLVELPDGTIGCFYEEGSWDASKQNPVGYRLVFKTFSLDNALKNVTTLN